MSEKVCKNCGAELSEDDEYCENCGAKVGDEELSDEEFNESITRDTTLQKELNEEVEAAQAESRFTPEYQAFLAQMEKDQEAVQKDVDEGSETLEEEAPLELDDRLKLIEPEPEEEDKIPTWVWVVGIIVIIVIIAIIAFLIMKYKK